MITKDEFLNKARKVHGNKYDYSNVKYVNSKTKVCIICPMHGEFWQTPSNHFRGQGCPKCKLETIRGIGVFGVGKVDSPIYTRDKVLKKSYEIWKSMLSRCFSEKYQNKTPTYIGCSVCEEWLTFSNFEKWFDKHYVKGCQLDKDIIVENCRVYSPDTCLFVPNEINALFKMSTLYYNKYTKEEKRNKCYRVYNWVDGKRKLIKRVEDINLAIKINFTNRLIHMEKVCYDFFNAGKIDEYTFSKIKNRLDNFHINKQAYIERIINEYNKRNIESC